MKFIKKVAALCFCAALALSVMAVSALADDTDPQITVTFTETTSTTKGANVNGDNSFANEYTSGTTVSYDIMLKTASATVTVDAFQFSAPTTGDGSATISSVSVTPVDTFTQNETNTNNGMYAYATSGVSDVTGLEVGSSTAVKVASISFTISGGAGDTKVFALSDFNIKCNGNGVSYDATSVPSVTLEIDPHYTITVNNPAISNQTHAIQYTSGNPTYDQAVANASTGYNILAGGTVTQPTLESDTYYTFEKYVVASGSGGNWSAGTEFVEDTTNNKTATEVLNAAISDKAHYGNLVLNAVYTPKVYHVTVVTPTESSANGTLEFTNTNYNVYTSAQLTASTSTTIDYTIEGKKNAVRADIDALAALPAKIAYTAVKYECAQTTNGVAKDNTWADIAAADVASFSIAEGRYGDVTLTAMYTPINYTVSYVFDDNATMTISSTAYTDNDATAYTLSYNINTAATNGFAFAVEPVRPGYAFDGWTAATTTDGETMGVTGAGVAWPTSIEDSDTKTLAPAGKYGDVTLTANWHIVGKFAKTTYAYAQTGYNLILFAVETVESGGYYVYDDNTPMYTTTKYSTVFGTAGNDSFDAGKTATNYTIFATIAPASEAAIGKVSFKAGTANGAIEYHGNVNAGTTPNAGDYGNVVAMLESKSYDNAKLDVKARLEADIVATNDGENDRQFGSIDDVIQIMQIAIGKITFTNT